MTTDLRHECAACGTSSASAGDRMAKDLNDFLGGLSAQARAEYGPTAAEWAEVNEEEVDE